MVYDAKLLYICVIIDGLIFLLGGKGVNIVCNTFIMKAKKLIEVALPIKEISAESVRDKSIRHGHISTLHLWWARRPLPVCRAVVFASLVPDPLDVNCPQAFKDAVKNILDPDDDKVAKHLYSTYPDIPYTAVFDPMEDNLRNRLMMFIGKFDDACQKNMIAGKPTSPKEQLSDGSLIKWENKNNPKILRMARELIWVAYNSGKNPAAEYSTLHKNFNEAFNAITAAEKALYEVVDRHLESAKVADFEYNLQKAIDNFQNQMPSVFDPFAGGGAIPLEAARLGCRSFGNDINPVAHIIEKGSAEFPQKYGKPIVYSKAEFERIYGKEGINMAQQTERNITYDGNSYTIPNRLAFDVEFYAKKILRETEEEVGYLYPADENGNKPVAFLWANEAICINPSCNAKIPLLRQFYLANTNNKKQYLEPIINDKNISFKISEGGCSTKAWFYKGDVTCPCCGAVTDSNHIKKQSREKTLTRRLVAIVSETDYGKKYSIPTESLINIIDSPVKAIIRPEGKLAVEYKKALPGCAWGFDTWESLFSERQLVVFEYILKALNSIKVCLPKNDYSNAVLTYLSILIDKETDYFNACCTWHTARETLGHLFSRQAIPIVFDHAEANPFSNSTGSLNNMIEWIVRYINSESVNSFYSIFINSSSGEKKQFNYKENTAVVTDPPYYDAIAYADISDFFYAWLKLSLGDVFPINFATPLTPKQNECTALSHYYNNSIENAKKHFETKLTQIFDAVEYQTSDIVSIMFAHQSTEAWTTLCNSILGARMNITGSWPMDTEMSNRSVGLAGAALESSVTVACRPSERQGFGDFKSVKKDIERKVSEEVESLYELGFRGADLLTACFGQAVSEFGKYKSVEKSDGSEVTVAELLEMARNAAFESLLKGVQGDDFTRFYIGWLQLNGTGETDFDDATKFTRVGVNVNIKDILQERLLILEGKKIHIAMAQEHIGSSSFDGANPSDSPIKQAHRLILLYKEGERARILRFVRDICPKPSSPLWRLLATLKELLPACDDQKQVSGILQNAEDLRQHCEDIIEPKQGVLEL